MKRHVKVRLHSWRVIRRSQKTPLKVGALDDAYANRMYRQCSSIHVMSAYFIPTVYMYRYVKYARAYDNKLLVYGRDHVRHAMTSYHTHAPDVRVSHTQAW